MYSISYSWIIDVEKHRKLLFSVCGWFVAFVCGHDVATPPV